MQATDTPDASWPAAQSAIYQLESHYLSQSNYVGRLHTVEMQLREYQSRLAELSTQATLLLGFALAGFIDPVLTDTAAPVVFVAITLLVWWRWGRYPAVLLGLAGACTGLTRLGDLVERPRPTPTVEWSGYSFGNGGYPSGHVVFAVLVLGTVAVLARRHARPRAAMWIVGAMQLLIAVTSWTRVSRLEHWPLDVVGGGLMAAAGLLGIIWLHPRLAAMVAGRPLLGRLLLAPGTSYSTDHLEV